jgi:hypothetical protein
LRGVSLWKSLNTQKGSLPARKGGCKVMWRKCKYFREHLTTAIGVTFTSNILASGIGLFVNNPYCRGQGKSDKILETVLRMDALLNSIHENLVSSRPALPP